MLGPFFPQALPQTTIKPKLNSKYGGCGTYLHICFNALVQVPFEAGRKVKICLAHSTSAFGHVSTFIELISYIGSASYFIFQPPWREYISKQFLILGLLEKIVVLKQ